MFFYLLCLFSTCICFFYCLWHFATPVLCDQPFFLIVCLEIIIIWRWMASFTDLYPRLQGRFFLFFSVLCCFLNNSTIPWPLVCMHFLDDIFPLGCISFLLLLKQNNQTWRLETRQTSIISWFRRLGFSYDFLNKKHCLERPGGSRGDSFPWLLLLYRAAYIGWSSSNHASLTSVLPSENSISRSLFPVSQFTNKEPYG